MYNHIMKHTSKPLIYLLPFSALAFLFLLTFSKPHHSVTNTNPHSLHISKHIQIAQNHCEGTIYPGLCVSTLSTFQDLHKKSLPEIVSAAVNFTVSEVRNSSSNVTGIRRRLPKLRKRDKQALDDCIELFSDTVAQLKTTIVALDNDTDSEKEQHQLQTLLSGAMTNQYTCLDGFAYSKSKVRRYIQENLSDISQHVSNSLAMLQKIKENSKKVKKEAFPEYGEVKRGFPTWLSETELQLLEADVNETIYDVMVAQDGSGNFSTIGEAVEMAPNMTDTRFVIYIKTGAYYENIEVVRRKRHLTFIGDGIGKTLVKGNRNVVDGSTTFHSATVAVVGNGFIAKGITFENYAGPSKHQAVALRSGSDLSVFYKCSFVAYQDTLYVHSLRQFYRDCDVYGTVDFIFGNAAVVFQNCNLYARKPNENQRNIFTAQGREDPNQNTGISILGCKVAAAADLIPVQKSFRNYLGRPWKLYSRTVFIGSHLGDLIEPAGFMEWAGDFALSTLYYGEYMNRGPGSNTSARITWPGYRVINSSIEAEQFSVDNFIQGAEWLNSTGVPFYFGLRP